jgi:ABC-type dipeptide/oligopeptide/nickel transport system permease component
MTVIIARRLGQSVLVIIGVTVAIFFILRLVPGDPVAQMAPMASDATRATLRHQLGLDQSVFVQFWVFITNAARGDFGKSYYQQTAVMALVLERIVLTLQIAVGAIALVLTVSVPLGVYAAVRRNKLFDRAVMGMAVLFQSLPNFWVALMLVLFVAASWGWLPAVGYEGWRSVILPAIALAMGLIAMETRSVRVLMIDVLQSEFIRAARNRGLSEPRILFKYALKNTVVPLLTMVGAQFGYLLGGAVIIEFIFDYPGLGLLTLNAVLRRDYPLIQGIVVVLALIFVVINLVVDLSYNYLDPRIRQQETS